MLFRAIAIAALLSACGPSVNTGGDDDAGPTVDAAQNDPDIDAAPDSDGDGYPEGQDCDDTDEDVYPGAPEVCGDGIDNNCNGDVDTDIECLEPCDYAAETDSYFGCTFYAVDLPQEWENLTTKKWAVSVANPDQVNPAEVTITAPDGETVAELTVAPQGLETYEVADRVHNVSEPGVVLGAYRIDSDRPIAVYQFNSIDTINAASTDASLLFASHSLATDYYVMEYDSFLSDADGNNFVAVYATEPDTSVELEPTAPTAEGPTSAVLQPNEVLLLTANPMGTGPGLTGTRVTADKPIGVFSGNRCTNVPIPVVWCDHLEQQIFPRQAIGTHYVVAKSHPRTHCELPDYIRILADQNGTTITLDPPVGGPYQLDAGEWVEVSVMDSVEVISDKPVLVGQFLASSGGLNSCENEGDPSFILQVPTAQFRGDYVFLTPPTYDLDYISIVAIPPGPETSGTTVMLDGELIPLTSATVGNSPYSVTRMRVFDGTHRLEATAPIGVLVYGYGGPDPPSSATRNVSYGYPGGLDLREINPIE